MNTFAIRATHPNTTGAARPEFYVVEIAANGEIINTSETYPSKSNAMRAARARAQAYTDTPRIEDQTHEEQ